MENFYAGVHQSVHHAQQDYAQHIPYHHHNVHSEHGYGEQMHYQEGSVAMAEDLLHQYLGHQEEPESLFSNMLGFAIENLHTGMDYIEEHPGYSEGHLLYQPMLSDISRFIRMTQRSTHSGRHTSDILEEIVEQLADMKEGLIESHSVYDQTLAEYLGMALQEVDVARYIEEYQHQKATRTGAYHYANQMKVPGEDASVQAKLAKSFVAPPLPTKKKVINIEGPVIITGDQSFDLNLLMRAAFPSPHDEFLALLQSGPPSQQAGPSKEQMDEWWAQNDAYYGCTTTGDYKNFNQRCAPPDRADLDANQNENKNINLKEFKDEKSRAKQVQEVCDKIAKTTDWICRKAAWVKYFIPEFHVIAIATAVQAGCAAEKAVCGIVEVFFYIVDNDLKELFLKGSTIDVMEALQTLTAHFGYCAYSWAIEIAISALKVTTSVGNLAEDGFFRGGMEELSADNKAGLESDTNILLETMKYAADSVGYKGLGDAIGIAMKAVEGAEVMSTLKDQATGKEVTDEQMTQSADYMRSMLDSFKGGKTAEETKKTCRKEPAKSMAVMMMEL